MISGCNSMVPGTATVLGTTCCLEQPGKCNYGKNTAGMAATATGEEHGGCEPEQRNCTSLPSDYSLLTPLFASGPVSLLLFPREIKCTGQVCVWLYLVPPGRFGSSGLR